LQISAPGPFIADAPHQYAKADRLDISSRSVPASVRAFSPEAFSGPLRSESASLRAETSLSFELTTREGDVVSFDFRQADFMSMLADERGIAAEAGFERRLSMSITGDLSDKELAAIDNMIAKVAEEASALFEGDLGEAAMRLASLGFESDALAAFSLDFRQSSYQSITRVYGQDARGTSGLADLARRDSSVAGLLDGIAAMQRRLIDDAKALFAPLDAARLGRSVVPAVLGAVVEPESQFAVSVR
jgi:hypothetical protein